MTRRPRILFLAGESEGGRRSVVGRIHIYSCLVHADIILRRAGPSYFSGEQGDFDDWSRWVSELENPQMHDRLYSAVLKSMVKLTREAIGGAVVVQGAIVGHPSFRVLMRDLLEREFSTHFRDADEALFWLDLPLPEVLDRAKVCNPNVTMIEIGQRVAQYERLIVDQSFRRFDSISACVAAATSILLDESE